VRRAGYSCRQGPAYAGIERASADADAALDFVRALPQVDASRIVVAGHSRGGLLAIVQAGRRPEALRGAINFVGGWLGEGCEDAALVNRSSFARGAPAPEPSLWLYARGDRFYSIEHSEANFAAFLAAGGRGSFHVDERAPGLEGHFHVNDAATWGPRADAWLAALRLARLQSE
jgi:dienelactone hydrolase